MTQIEEVLAMYYDENLTDNEIAEALCIDVSTVKYILRHNSFQKGSFNEGSNEGSICRFLTV